MSDQNILISNGTCYTAPGQKLDGSFIPCGNDAFGHQTCCGAGDNCLADNSCFGFHGTGYGSYLTYQAGCSDPDYKDPSCPDKHIDQPWIALTLCDNSGGIWAVCSQEGNPTTLRPGSYCSCTNAASSTTAFSDATSLTSSASLPQSTGESISFFAGHTPSGSPTAGTTAPASSSSATSGSSTPSQTSSSAASTSSPSGTGAGSSGGATQTQGGSTASSQSGTGAGNSGSTTSTHTGSGTSSLSGAGAGNSGAASQSGTGTSSSGLSSGAKIGIAVGAAVGGLILLAAIAALFFLRRRRRHFPSGSESGSTVTDKKEKPSKLSKLDSKLDSSNDKHISDSSTQPGAWDADGPWDLTDGPGVAEADGQAARPWSMRSELEGSPVAASLAERVAGVAPVGDAHGGPPPVSRGPGGLSPVAETGPLGGRPPVNRGPGGLSPVAETSPIAELPATEARMGPRNEDRRPQGVGQVPAQSGIGQVPAQSGIGQVPAQSGIGQVPAQTGGDGPQQTTGHSPVDRPIHSRILVVVGPEGAHFPGEQGAGHSPAQEAGPQLGQGGRGQ